ncbi:MAG: (4Fe-4S)-binding protein, partial [Bacteroidia bacterium]|nr:(4Fe-4S)-binding protein [Bacteroidia bacterium]
MKKEYQKGEMTIVWEPGKCIHSGICAKGLPAVFKPSEKPWIQADNSETETLKKQIVACPSGALSYYLKNQDEQHSNDQDTFKVQVIPNG